MDTLPTPSTGPAALPRWVWMTAGGVALGVAGIASALALQSARQTEAAAPPPVASAKAMTNHATSGPARAPAAESHAAAASCAQCGVVESVQSVQVKGEGSGVGAVAGGVLGGVVGNQFGHGNGRAAMTVLGAVGGGFAGNEVEKRVKAKTVYNVKVRMDDGTLRTLQQAQAPAIGARVQVDGKTLRMV